MSSHDNEDSLDFADENEEWAKIEKVMASLDTGLSGQQVIDDEEGFRDILEGSQGDPSCMSLDGGLTNGKAPPYFKNSSFTTYDRSLSEWLASNNLSKYEHLLITNGFDDLKFMGPDIMSEDDLIEIGMSDDEDRLKLITDAQLIQNPPSPSTSSSVKDWLMSLNLPDYYETFAVHGCVNIDDLLNIWDLQLTSVFHISRLGHRNRIMASINSFRSRARQTGSKESVTNGCHDTPDVHHKPAPQNICLTDYLLHRQNPNNYNNPNYNYNNHHLGDVSLFKDYSSLKSNKSGRSSASSTLRRSEEAGQSSEVITLEEVLRNCGVLEPAIKVMTPSSLTSTTNSLPPTTMSTNSINNQPVNHNNNHQHGLSNFSVTYLGTVKLLCIEKPDLARKCIEQIRSSPVENRKVVISVSCQRVIFRDQSSQEIMGAHDVSNVFCVCQDSEMLEYFAFVTWDVEESVHFCHVFNAQYIKLSTDVVLALGKAFEVAFQLIQQESSVKQNGRSLSSSSSSTSPSSTTTVMTSRPKTTLEKRSTFV